MFGLNSFGDFSMVCGANSFISSIWILLKIYVPDHNVNQNPKMKRATITYL